MSFLLSHWEDSRAVTGLKAIVAIFGYQLLKALWDRYNRRSVKGDTVVITGGASGLGRLTALRLAKLGAKVILWDVQEDGLKRVAEEIKAAGGAVYTYPVDLRSRDDIYKTAEKTKADVGKVDILINNAGIVSGKCILDPNFDDEAAARVLKINTEAHFWTTRAFVPEMVSSNKGHVVTIASAAGISGVAGLSDYCASKFGAFGFDESLRLEFKKKKLSGCHTTCVCPFYIDTGMFDGAKSKWFFLPILKQDYVADEIVRGILERRNYVILPKLVYLTFIARILFPTWFTDKLGEFLGLSNSMDDFVGRKTGH